MIISHRDAENAEGRLCKKQYAKKQTDCSTISVR